MWSACNRSVNEEVDKDVQEAYFNRSRITAYYRLHQSGEAQGGKTEVLPADGGDLGKAFLVLQNALKTADKAVAAKLLDPNSWHLDNKEPGWFEPFSERLSQYRAVGGKRQGDRATLSS